MKTVSLILSDDETKILDAYTHLKQLTIAEFLKQAALERIEDEYDLESFKTAKAEFTKNPVVYSHEEVVRMLAED